MMGKQRPRRVSPLPPPTRLVLLALGFAIACDAPPLADPTSSELPRRQNAIVSRPADGERLPQRVARQQSRETKLREAASKPGSDYILGIDGTVIGHATRPFSTPNKDGAGPSLYVINGVDMGYDYDINSRLRGQKLTGIKILKGAEAKALYGSRVKANGLVILIELDTLNM